MNEFIKFLASYAITASDFVDVYKASLEKELLPNDRKILDKGLEFFKKSKSKPIPRELIGNNSRLSDYIDLWPKRILDSGKPARANEKVLFRCFTWFFTNYHYRWEVVIEATYRYLAVQKNTNYKMCRTNQYFIDKTTSGIRESVLADYCELVINGEESLPSDFKEKVV